jgi:protein prenyltransferase alpha subunit repeat containing protein 1
MPNFALPPLRKSIEILPGAIDGWVPESTPTYPFLFAEDNLGVPQRVLYKAYMVAVHAYFGFRNESRKSTPSLQQSNLLDRLTRVILLANPAHQTALNSRKELIQNNAMDPHWELNFSGSLLSCRECAKESILWHHRRWLLHVIHEVPALTGGDTIPANVPPDALEAEFTRVSTACHLYPRNYHAWTHRRLCVKALITSLHPEFPSTSGVLLEEHQRTLEWIESHISDYSAMSYATYLEKMLPSGKPPDGCLPTKEHATSLLRSYPNSESLWMYLRGSMAHVGGNELPTPVKEASSSQKSVLRHVVWRKIIVCFISSPNQKSIA